MLSLTSVRRQTLIALCALVQAKWPLTGYKDYRGDLILKPGGLEDHTTTKDALLLKDAMVFYASCLIGYVFYVIQTTISCFFYILSHENESI